MKKTIKLYLLISLFLASNFSFAGDTHIVKMLNMSDEGSMVFEPAFIKINAGDSITFEMTNAGHNAATVYGPVGSVPFDTKYKPSTTIKFDVSGLYLYKCSPHAMMAMVGVIQVGEPINKQEIDALVGDHKDSFMMNETRLSNYLARL